MSSSGNYFYRYNGLYYNFPSAQLNIFQSYDTQLKKKNKVYEKITENEPMFSPFTTWKLKLVKNTNNIDLLSKLSK